MAGTQTRRPAKSIAEKMIKVDHAGENGAVNIYRAQHLVSRLRSPSLCPQLKEFQDHEESHREIFRTYLDASKIRPCISYHLCGIGGYALGFVTAIVGSSAIMATTYAVENVVLTHLHHQSDYLKEADIPAYDCVERIIIDEQEHHDHAFENFDKDGGLSKLIVRIVKLCTESVIRFGMR